MKIKSKLFIVFALLCVGAAAAYGQDCNGYLQQATELMSQKKYCSAKSYYQRYGNCNADADVSTEIAMCERLCRINVMEGEEEAPVEVITEREKPAPAVVLPDSRPVTPVPNGNASAKGAKARLGLSPGLMYPTDKNEELRTLVLTMTGEDNTYLCFGGGINTEYLFTPHVGVGINIGYYGCELEFIGGGTKVTKTLIPLTSTIKYYALTKSVQPYLGLDMGTYVLKTKAKYQGGDSESISSSHFGLAPALGIQFKLSKVVALDVNAKYNLLFGKGNTTGLIIGCNAGLVFTFGK